MTEQEAIKLVKKQNRQNRIENIKCWFSEYGIPILVASFGCILALVIFMWPLTLKCFKYQDNAPAWLDILCPIWTCTWLGCPLVALLVAGTVSHIKDKRQKFREQVQDELNIAKHREELAPRIEQWLVEHGYRNTNKYNIVEVYLHEYRNVGNVAYKNLEYKEPEVNWYLCIDLDKEEEEQGE